MTVVANAWKSQTLLLDSVYETDLLACAVVGLWPKSRRPAILMYGEMWNRGRGLTGLIQSAVVALADRAICRYIVWSTEEKTAFPGNWGVDPAKVRCCPFFYTLTEKELEPGVESEGYVFAGGNSHRDYQALLEAAKRLPHLRFVIATTKLRGRDLPPNVLAQPTTHEEFIDQLRKASAVVIPMRKGLRRSAGQQTYLNAMLLGKPTIVTEAYGVRDHVSDGETALIVPNEEQSLSEALTWVFDEKNIDKVEQMCARARGVVSSRFSFGNHMNGILSVLDEVRG